jgi:hypothetical protein
LLRSFWNNLPPDLKSKQEKCFDERDMETGLRLEFPQKQDSSRCGGAVVYLGVILDNIGRTGRKRDRERRNAKQMPSSSLLLLWAIGAWPTGRVYRRVTFTQWESFSGHCLAHCASALSGG